MALLIHTYTYSIHPAIIKGMYSSDCRLSAIYQEYIRGKSQHVCLSIYVYVRTRKYTCAPTHTRSTTMLTSYINTIIMKNII